MSLSNAAEDSILNLYFSATTWANFAINATSSPETNIVVALSTADPGDAGTGSTSEATYTGYGRVNVGRSAGFAASSGGSVSPAAAITFGAGSGGSGTVTNFATTKSGGGASINVFVGTVTPNIVTGNGVTPQLSTATVFTLD